MSGATPTSPPLIGQRASLKQDLIEPEIERVQEKAIVEPPEPREVPRTSSLTEGQGQHQLQSKSSFRQTTAAAAAKENGAAGESASGATGGGGALDKSDSELITMLQMPPKHVPQLRTREGFRRFFAGIETNRMQSLLTTAYSEKEPEEAAKKVAKRMQLIADVLV